MEKIYITGHRNPDLDSICSAYAYAKLKNRTDSDNEYLPVRCGHLSDYIKAQLEAVGLEKMSAEVPYKRNVYPKVSDVMNRLSFTMDADEPIYNLLQKYDADRPSAMPVFDGEKYLGLLSIDDVTNWFLKDNSDALPLYTVDTDNILKVLPGKFIKRGKPIENAAMVAGAADIDFFSKYISANKDCVIAMGYREEHIKAALKTQVQAIIVTTTDSFPDVDVSDFKGIIYVTSLNTSETLRRLRMAVSIRHIMGVQGLDLQADTLFEDAKDSLIKSKLRGLSVFDGDELIGFVTRRCFLNKPSYSVILVDHNETDQSIKGIETATVKEIIDHHRLDALKTNLPIFIDAEPIGSTCSIVYQQYVRNSVVPDKETAKILLTGIISDTLILRSPTTTDTDRSSAGALAALCGIFDITSFGEKLFSCSESLENSDENSVINSDFKTYIEHGRKIGIGQCETTTLKNVKNYSQKYIEALNRIKTAQSYDWTMLMVTDVLAESSVLFVSESVYNGKLLYSRIDNHVYDMPKIMSRKKQLLPEILHCLD